MENLYKKRFPKRSFDDTVFDVLRMGPKKWTQFQGIAKQFQGSLKPKKKLLPSAIETVATVDSPNTLAALMHQEKIAHDTTNLEYHMGGGIYETAGSVFSTLWGLCGKPVYESWFGHHEGHQKQKITALGKQYAKAVSESYKVQDERDNVGDWELQPDQGTDRFAVFKDGNRVHVALRGTKASVSDMFKDGQIIWHNRVDDTKAIRDKLVEIAQTYPDAELDVSGHSLGGNQLVNALEGDDNAELKRYDRINLYNPGTQPFGYLDKHKLAVEDDRVHLYLNTGDVLSNTFTYLIDSDRDNVTYSSPSHSPLHNHGLSQWSDI